MRSPTRDQQTVLESNARIRVVRAVPGSGKTWLIAEIIRQSLDKGPKGTSGIAALSFTRVGGDEIRKAVGQQLGHPHFVGTIDAFLFRYVIRPYLRRVFFSSFSDPRLLVGDWGAEYWGNYGLGQSATVEGINVFGCVCVGEDQGEPVIAYKPHPLQTLKILSGRDLDEVKKAKRAIWRTRGLLTHSDVALLTSKVLMHPKLGSIICSEIARRFPFLIVDELQDTGYFLAKSIRLLLENGATRGLLVGDPDQAIYEFTGARPDLFNTFERITDAVTLPLASSRRCPSASANAAKHLKETGGLIGPAEDRVGSAFLVRYNDMVADVSNLVEELRLNRSIATLKVVARASATVDELAGRRAGDAPSLYCPPLAHLHRAVVAFRRGRNISALAAARAALERVIFQHEGIGEEELRAVQIDLVSWKALAVRCLLQANAIASMGTLFDWHTQAGKVLDNEISGFGLGGSLAFKPGKLKPQRRKGWDKLSAYFLPQSNNKGRPTIGVPVQTVHSVKGETHDTTIFVIPPTNKVTSCPSVAWWSSDDDNREERRIAYVAMTRTHGDLFVCVSEACYQRLATSRADFVAAFKCVAVTECIALIRRGMPKSQATTADSPNLMSPCHAETL